MRYLFWRLERTIRRWRLFCLWIILRRLGVIQGQCLDLCLFLFGSAGATMTWASQNFVRHSCHMLRSSPEDDKWLIVSSNAEASVSASRLCQFCWSFSIPVGLTACDTCRCFVVASTMAWSENSTTAVLCMGCHFIYNNGGQFRFHSLCMRWNSSARWQLLRNACFSIGRDATAAIVVNEMRETAVSTCSTIPSVR